MDTPHYQKGNQIKIAVVFSCPGKEEEDCGLAASGKTGDNLNLLLAKLDDLNFLKTKLTKENLRITNAWDKVIYKSKDKRTEAKLTFEEIYSAFNLKRIESELIDIEDYIICSGKKAFNAVSKLKFENKNIKIIEIPHLGLNSINRKLKNDINGRKIVKGNKQNNLKRIEVIAYDIINQNL